MDFKAVATCKIPIQHLNTIKRSTVVGKVNKIMDKNTKNSTDASANEFLVSCHFIERNLKGLYVMRKKKNHVYSQKIKLNKHLPFFTRVQSGGTSAYLLVFKTKTI